MNSKNLLFLLLILACIAFTIYIFQPGYMNADAVDQLGQARSGQFNDWHPPVMSWMWQWTDKVLPGPMGMFALQIVLFWGGLGLMAAFASPKPLIRSLFLLIGFYPPLFMLLSAIVKDVLMTAVILFGFALFLWAGRKRSLALFFAGLVFLTYGMMTRHNAILIALPIFLYAGFIFIDLAGFKAVNLIPLWRGIIMGMVFFAIAYLMGSAWSGSITKIKSHPFQQIMVHDLTAISLRTKSYLLPEYLAASDQPSMKDLRHLYNTRSLKNLYWPDFTSIHFKILYDPALVDDLTKTWARTVLEYPRAYLEHRWNVFAATMGITNNKACGPYYYEETVYKPKGYYQNDSGNYYSENRVTNLLFTLMEPLRESPLYWNWPYALFCLVLFAVSLGMVFKGGIANISPLLGAPLTLSAGASMYALANLFVAISCDFRYVHWNVTAALISAVFLFATRNSSKNVR